MFVDGSWRMPCFRLWRRVTISFTRAPNATSNRVRIPLTNKLSPFLLLLLLCSCARPIDPPEPVLRQLNLLLETQEYRLASQRAEEILKKYPRSARLEFLLGEAWLYQGNFEKALSVLEKASQGGVRSHELNVSLALTHFYLGHLEEAQVFTRRVVTLQPENRWSAKQLAYLFYYLGDGKKAIELMKQLEETDRADLEAVYALDALGSLTGLSSASEMVWTTEPDAGMQLCYPGGWAREDKHRLGPAGKVTTIRFVGPTPGQEGRFRFAQMLLLTTFQNASAHPFPEDFRGAYRRGERVEGGEVRYATRPNPEVRMEKMSRDPAKIAQRLSGNFLQFVLDEWGLSLQDSSISPWTAMRGRATTCWGGASGEDSHGNSFLGYSLGVYDPTTDTFSSLVLIGPADAHTQIEGLSRAVFNLALFGGVIGIPPVPERFVSAEEFEARIQGFLQAASPDRALTEAQRAIGIYPNVGTLQFLLGEVQRALWRPEKAAAAYEAARDLGFSNFSMEMSLGGALLGLGAYQRAREAFGNAARFRPNDSEPLLAYGVVLFQEGELEEALAFFERVLAQDPKHPHARFYADAVKALGGKEDPEGSLWWFHPVQGGLGFPVPKGWQPYKEPQEKDLGRILFTQGPIDPTSRSFDTGLLYLRYDHAQARTGRVARLSPEEMAQQFFVQSFERISDPQKVLQTMSAGTFRRELDRYVVGGYAYTKQSQRRQVRIVSYYETARDRLHVLLFESSASEFAEWEPYLFVLQSCARLE